MKDVLVNLEHISKSYDSHMVLDDLNLYIRENEFLTLRQNNHPAHLRRF